MIRIQGKHNEAVCYTSILEELTELLLSSFLSFIHFYFFIYNHFNEF